MATSDTAADTAADAVDADDDEGGGGGGGRGARRCDGALAGRRARAAAPMLLGRARDGAAAGGEGLGAFVTQLRAHGADGELCAAAPKIFAATPRLTPRSGGSCARTAA